MEARNFLETARRLCMGKDCEVGDCPFAFIHEEKVACMLVTRQPCYFDVDKILEAVNTEKALQELRVHAREVLRNKSAGELAKFITFLIREAARGRANEQR